MTFEGVRQRHGSKLHSCASGGPQNDRFTAKKARRKLGILFAVLCEISFWHLWSHLWYPRMCSDLTSELPPKMYFYPRISKFIASPSFHHMFSIGWTLTADTFQLRESVYRPLVFSFCQYVIGIYFSPREGWVLNPQSPCSILQEQLVLLRVQSACLKHIT